MGTDGKCMIKMSVYRNDRDSVLDFLAALPSQAGVEVISFDTFLCDFDQCRTRLDDTCVFRDKGHLSQEGSVAVANATSLVAKIYQLAK